MTGDGLYLLVRAASVYLVAAATLAVWAWRRPPARAWAGALLAGVWNVPVVLALQMAAGRFGWWAFDAEGGLLAGMPVEMFLAWAWLWGAVPALALPAAPIAVIAAAAAAIDVVLMPLAAPVLHLGRSWLIGEAIGIAAGVVPGQLLARWTQRDERLFARAALQVVTFTGVMLFVLPAVVIEATGGWLPPWQRPSWQIALGLQVLALPAVIGLTAVQEFATRGGGTPVPFDAPQRLVTTGIYAYVANPMQLSAVLLLIALGLVLNNLWVSAAGVMAHVYSAGLAGWDEDADLGRRFGDGWTAYRLAVRRWLPRLRPCHHPDARPATLFIGDACGMCRDVRLWFEARSVRQLAIVPAETHPSGALTRITYEPADGSRTASGVGAVARALEHTHLGWALVGCALRLPGISALAQLLVDASGGAPRSLPSSPPPGAPANAGSICDRTRIS